MFLKEKISMPTKLCLIWINVVPLLFLDNMIILLVCNSIGILCFSMLCLVNKFTITLLFFISGNGLSILYYFYPEQIGVKFSMNISYLFGASHYMYKLYEERNFDRHELVKYNEFFTSSCFILGNAILVIESFISNIWILMIGKMFILQAFINVYLLENMVFALRTLDYTY